eukprot:4290963-Amphidinium_carterae.1
MRRLRCKTCKVKNVCCLEPFGQGGQPLWMAAFIQRVKSKSLSGADPPKPASIDRVSQAYGNPQQSSENIEENE